MALLRCEAAAGAWLAGRGAAATLVGGARRRQFEAARWRQAGKHPLGSVRAPRSFVPGEPGQPSGQMKSGKAAARRRSGGSAWRGWAGGNADHHVRCLRLTPSTPIGWQRDSRGGGFEGACGQHGGSGTCGQHVGTTDGLFTIFVVLKASLCDSGSFSRHSERCLPCRFSSRSNNMVTW